MATTYLLILGNADAFALENSDSLQLNLGADINTLTLWKGAVEPSESSSSGNQLKMWKGAVEPAAPASSGNILVGGVGRSVTRNITRGVTESFWRV